MNVRWKKLLVKTTLWLVAEIWFNFLGIDDLADYSEFIFEKGVHKKFENYKKFKETITNCFKELEDI